MDVWSAIALGAGFVVVANYLHRIQVATERQATALDELTERLDSRAEAEDDDASDVMNPP
jgi:hypothetical protein